MYSSERKGVGLQKREVEQGVWSKRTPALFLDGEEVVDGVIREIHV
jgi:hypothetical protein